MTPTEHDSRSIVRARGVLELPAEASMRSLVGAATICAVLVACGGTSGDDLLFDGGDGSTGTDATQNGDVQNADTGGGGDSGGDAISCP